jgi:hypothetical protein
MAWLLIKMTSDKKSPPDNNDGGGFNGDGGLPIIDLPPSTKISDWLTDRNPTDTPKQQKVKSLLES